MLQKIKQNALYDYKETNNIMQYVLRLHHNQEVRIQSGILPYKNKR